MFVIKAFIVISVILLNIINNSSCDEQFLKQLHVLFRHGERTPTETYPNDPYVNFKWPSWWGHLTNRGKRQMYDFGQLLRNEYYPNFFPPHFWHKETNFTSSYSVRCLMSAELVAAGLFPPKDYQIWHPDLLWQPIPIHYLPRSQDNTIVMRSACAKYDAVFKDVLNSTKVLKMIADNKVLYEYLTEHTGITVDNLEAVESIFNTLEIEKLHNLTLPYWVNDTVMRTMEQIGAQNLALYSDTEYMKRMKGGVFLRHVITLMRKSNSSTIPSINMYSGHDLTLVHVLRALNLIDTLKPGYGASLIIELYSNMEVKLIYRNTWDSPAEIMILEHCQTPCYLEQFEEANKAVLPLDWDNECQIII